MIAAGFALVDGVGDGSGFDEDALAEVAGAEAESAEFFTVCPLFQTKRDPLFTHVYFFPALIEVAFNFVHLSPALTAATA